MMRAMAVPNDAFACADDSATETFQLEGGVNFRDLGGHVTTDGRRVRRGVLFRSGAFDRLTERDVAALRAGGVVHVIDFRDPGEVVERPDARIPGAHTDVVPANPTGVSGGANLHQVIAQVEQGGDPAAFMDGLYRKLPFENPAYRHLFACIQKLEAGALVFHCMVGKDRTGVAAALVLLALGVPRAAVVEDYLKTGPALARFRELALAELAVEAEPSSLESLKVLMASKAEFIDAALDEIDTRFGDIWRFLEVEFGLTAERLAALRAKFLE